MIDIWIVTASRLQSNPEYLAQHVPIQSEHVREACLRESFLHGFVRSGLSGCWVLLGESKGHAVDLKGRGGHLINESLEASLDELIFHLFGFLVLDLLIELLDVFVPSSV